MALIDVNEGCETEFMTLARTLASLILRKGYGRAVTVRDEAVPSRFYTVRHWSTAAAAEQCHADAESQAVTARLYQIARVTQVVNGVRHLDHSRLLMEDRRARAETVKALDPTTSMWLRCWDHPDGIGAPAASFERRRSQYTTIRGQPNVRP